MPFLSIGPQKRKGIWTIRRLLAAASDETPPRLPPQPAVLRDQSAKRVRAPHQPSRRAPAPTRPARPAPDGDWPQETFTWPHEDFAPIADDEPPSRLPEPRVPDSRGEQDSWGMPMLGWGAGRAGERPPQAPSRPAARPRPRLDAAPPRSSHPLPTQGAVPHPAQRRIQEASRQQYREALTEALQREPRPEAGRQLAARPAAQARPGPSRAKAARERAAATEARREQPAAPAPQEDAEAKARDQFLAKIRRQQEVIQARLQYALAELRYEAPSPPLLPPPAEAHRGRAMVPAEARRTPPRRPAQAGRYAVPPSIVAVAIRSVKRVGIAAGAFSLFTNLLTLAGPLFLMGAFEFAPDSVPTLLALSILLVVLLGALALLDRLRGQIVKRAAGGLDTDLDPATRDAVHQRLAAARGIPDGPLRDITSLRQFMSGSGPTTFLDLPWAPIALLIITMMHWSLGAITAIGMAVMAAIAAVSEARTRALLQNARQASVEATRLALESSHDIAAMAAENPIVLRWHEARQRAETAMRRAGDRMAAFASASAIVRTVMQSVLLGAGALLLIGHEISSGMMIAVSVIGGKALGPIGGAVSQWRGLIGARDAFGRLEALHKRHPTEPKRLLPPEPKGGVEVRDLQVTPADAEVPVIQKVSFTLKAGQALGVIGASAAGRSALMRALVGLETPNSGWVRLDGADLRMLNPEELGAKVGRLPQPVELYEGTVGENIARFDISATPDAIARAAAKVGIADMIAGLPERYDFEVGSGGLRLSAAQRYRVGLARALFGDPLLVVLEEPANLDALGKAALRQAMTALRESRTTVILITSRPEALDAVDHVMVIEDGKPRTYGRKSKVLEALAAAEGGKPAVAASARTALSHRSAKAAPALKRA